MANQETQVGVFLGGQYPAGVGDLSGVMSEQCEMLRVARDGGWDSVWVGQHYLPGITAELQPVPFLSRLSAESGNMDLGFSILLLPLMNPVDVAESVATLDIISGGRITLGVGLGYRDVEYEAFGVERSERVYRLGENVRIIKALWTGEPVYVDLPWCRIDGQRMTALPIGPPPPIWVAANSDAAVERAAVLGDAWLMNPHATRTMLMEQLSRFHAARSKASLDPVSALPLMREVFCASDRKTAYHSVEPYLRAKYAGYVHWGQDRAMPDDPAWRGPFENLHQERFIIGNPEDCLSELLKYRDELGVTHFILRTAWLDMPLHLVLESMRLLSAEVVPVLRRT